MSLHRAPCCTSTLGAERHTMLVTPKAESSADECDGSVLLSRSSSIFRELIPSVIASVSFVVSRERGEKEGSNFGAETQTELAGRSFSVREARSRTDCGCFPLSVCRGPSF